MLLRVPTNNSKSSSLTQLNGFINRQLGGNNGLMKLSNSSSRIDNHRRFRHVTRQTRTGFNNNLLGLIMINNTNSRLTTNSRTHISRTLNSNLNRITVSSGASNRILDRAFSFHTYVRDSVVEKDLLP